MNQLKRKHQQEDQTLEQHYAEQLAALTENVGGLNSIQNAYYQQATIEAQNFVNTNLTTLQQLYRATFTGSGLSGGGSVPSASGGIGLPLGTPSPGNRGIGSAVGSVLGNLSASSQGYNYGAGRFPTTFTGTPFPSFASGIDRLPSDVIALLHKGERVIRAVDNHPGGEAPVYYITVNNQVGDLVSKRKLDDAIDEIALGIRRGVFGT